MDEWTCALHGRILMLRQDATHLHYRAAFPVRSTSPTALPTSHLPTPPPSTNSSSFPGTDTPPAAPILHDDTPALLQRYLNLSADLTSLYAQWSAADANFRAKAPRFTGVRVLRQDAWEALVGFVCSSNNNIARISQMVHRLCAHYGPLIGTYAGGEPYHDFPEPCSLAGEHVEAELRALGFGYRARYISETARMIVRKEQEEPGWLEGLRNPEAPVLAAAMSRSAGEMAEGGREGYRRAHAQLLALQGVGPKVADCVCLMGLGWGEAVPVDTHGASTPSRPVLSAPSTIARDSEARMLTSVRSVADCAAGLQVRQGQARQPDAGDVRRDW